MIYQVLPSRYGFNPDHMKMAQAVEIVVGQGAKPGTGGVLLGSKVSAEIAEQRTLPVGWTSARRCATPTSSDPMTSSSRSRRVARRPTGRFRCT